MPAPTWIAFVAISLPKAISSWISTPSLHDFASTRSTALLEASFDADLLRDYAENHTPEWLKTIDSLPFSCTECGKCCQRQDGDVYMNHDEFSKAAAYLGMDNDSFIRTYSTHVMFDDHSKPSWVHIQNKESCVFLDRETKHCKIHAVKPVQCNAYPFYPTLLASPDKWDGECRRQDNDTETTLPTWTPNAGGCEGMKPINSTEAKSTEGFPMNKVYEQLYLFEKHEFQLFGDRYNPGWRPRYLSNTEKKVSKRVERPLSGKLQVYSCERSLAVERRPALRSDFLVCVQSTNSR